MQVVVAFPVNQKRIRTCFGELFQVKIRVGNHQVGLQVQARHGPQRLYDHRSHRNVGHEVPIHDIDVDPIGPGFFRFRYLLTQTGKVSGKDRWGKFYQTLVHFWLRTFRLSFTTEVESSASHVFTTPPSAFDNVGSDYWLSYHG